MRHGDSCVDAFQPWRKCRPLSAYVAELRRLFARYGSSYYVYLATDSEDVVRQTRDFPDVTFRSQRLGRGVFDRSHGAVDDREMATADCFFDHVVCQRAAR